ncbi:MAG: Hint domain-containing protein [Acetobacter sp.]|jgi:hypothetical protein|nr:Hint domain-containing protein [Acetobacter sp.]MCH4061592.1 Hint domain-containing protein [Acetobacter sp.]MCH4089559.1 Hint domain-containing protein [Acetobacter sp.]MCI1294723.1 Hint domain-containing protein [Acetobacter sp.]MCI1321412.1 Hint domain-containing protein [Acetobacter sp.]
MAITKTSSGVTYEVNETLYLGGLYHSYDVKIIAPDGTVILDKDQISPGVDLGAIKIAASGDVITGSSDSSVLLNLASVGTYVSVPGSTGSFIIGAGLLTYNTYYIGGKTTIEGLANIATGSTINVVGGTAKMPGTGGSLLAGVLSGTTVNIEYGGTFNTGASLASVLEGATINFGAGGGTLIINGGGTAISLLASGSLNATTFNNYDPSKDTIELQNTTAAITYYKISDGGLFGTDSSEKIIRLYGAGSSTPIAEYAVSPASGVTLNNGTYAVNGLDTASNPLQVTYDNSNTYIGACFLSGSMIRTKNGDIAIENIHIGDEIIAFDWESQSDIVRQVIWAGKAHVDVRPHLMDDQAGWPIRILKNAISDGVPYKDMLITAEHCLFFNNKFVPARMLVNGRSIFYDKSFVSYDYYHIETEQHAVVVADGMLTESYLDTGNRSVFRQTDDVVAFMPSRHLSWENAAAPLDVEQGFVEPIYRQIEERAVQTGIMDVSVAPELTAVTNLHLMTDNGVVIRQVRQRDDHVVFMIPTGVTSVRLVSNASRPCDTIGPFVDDRRQLGVAVGEICIFEGSQSHQIAAHLEVDELDGWHMLEASDMRWTSGDALLPLNKRLPNGTAFMSIQIKATVPYMVDMIGERLVA